MATEDVLRSRVSMGDYVLVMVHDSLSGDGRRLRKISL